jgi:hypothetical protein
MLSHFNISNYNNLKNFVKTGLEFMGPMIYDPRVFNYAKNFYQDPNNADVFTKMPIFKDNPTAIKAFEDLKDPKVFDEIMKKENIDKALKIFDVEPFDNRKSKKDKNE